MKNDNSNGGAVVGDIFVNSWGYDQTNVDAYQVVRLSKAYAFLAPIEVREVPGSSGMMCRKVEPVKDKFIAGAVVPQMRVRVDRISRGGFAPRHGWASRHFAGASYHESWYA